MDKAEPTPKPKTARRTKQRGPHAKMREAVLVRERLQGATILEAGRAAGFQGGDLSVISSASRALGRPHVQEQYRKAMDKLGLSIEKSVGVMLDAHEATKIVPAGAFKTKTVKDHNTRLRAVELAGRFRGGLESEAAAAARGAAQGVVQGLGYFVMKGRADRGLPPLDVTP